MKKLFALSLAMLFIGVGIASATDVEIKGSYYARGSYKENIAGTGTNAEGYGVYDHELSVNVNFKIDDTTAVYSVIEMRDDEWATSSPTEGTALFDGNDGTGSAAAAGSLDDNIIIEKVYGSHTFGNGLVLDVGLMNAGQWMSDFGNEGGEAYRVKAVMPTSFGNVYAITQKAVETEAVDEDYDAYYLGLVTKMNDITIAPLLVYANNDVPTATPFEQFAAVLYVGGAMDNIGWEVEAEYEDYDFDAAANTDYEVFGIYGSVWMQMDALKLTGIIAYGSYDDEANEGYQFGDDFACGGALLLGDDVFLDEGSVTGTGSYNDMQGVTLLAVKLGYAVSDKLSLGAYLGWAESNVDEDASDPYDGANAWEISANGSYKITANVTYSVAAGLAQIEWGDNQNDPDEAVEVHHKLSFSF